MQSSIHGQGNGFSGWLRHYRYWLVAFTTGLMLLGSSLLTPVSAQSPYPPFLDPHVNDYGQVLAPTDAAALRSTLGQFQAESGVQVVVVTVNSINDYRTGDSAIETFATNLFNTWGIGDRTRNDGILILVAPGDRKVRIELGSGYPAYQNDVAADIIEDTMLPYFRSGSFSQGTYAGAQAVITRFSQGTAQSNSWASGVMRRLERTPLGWILAGFMSLITIGGVGALKQWQRYRKRNCPKCQTEMIRLDEVADDQHLSGGQQLEETLASVDYDVWECPSCRHREIKNYDTLMSRYQRCPSCQHKTMQTERRTLVSPTYSSTGSEQVTETCQHCSRHNIYHNVIPMLTRSDDNHSSGSNGGGGSSSGGGATGSW